MDYGEFTRYLCDVIEDSVVDGRLDFPRYTFADAVIGYFAGAEMIIDDNGSWYLIGPEFSSFLFGLALSHYQFFDLCAEICATNIASSRPLPHMMDAFAASFLRGNLKRPTPRHRPRNENWLELSFIHSLVLEGVEAGLKRTRNDFSSNRNSACDAVAEALTVCGRRTQYNEIKNLMVHADFEPHRREFRATQRIFGRSHDRRISFNALDLEGYGAREEMERLVMQDILSAFAPSRGKSP